MINLCFYGGSGVTVSIRVCETLRAGSIPVYHPNLFSCGGKILPSRPLPYKGEAQMSVQVQVLSGEPICASLV